MYESKSIGKEQGRRVMRSEEHIQGSQPLSRYGIPASCLADLTLGITRSAPAFGAGRASPI